MALSNIIGGVDKADAVRRYLKGERKADLARLYGVSRGYMTKVLRGVEVDRRERVEELRRWLGEQAEDE